MQKQKHAQHNFAFHSVIGCQISRRIEMTDAIHAALSETTVDVELLRRLSTEHGIPDDIRVSVWKHFLALHHRSSTFPDDASLFDAADPIIKDAIGKIAEACGGAFTSAAQQSAIAALQFYCVKKQTPFQQLFGEICGPLALLQLPAPDIFNMLYVIIERHLPFVVVPADAALTQPTIACISELLRLLVQYHDPQLQLHLDGQRLPVGIYTAFWTSTFFTQQLGPRNAHFLWDFLFTSTDPVLLGYVAVAFLTFHREHLLAIEGTDRLVAEINALSFPSSAESIRDLITTAKRLQKQTPPSANRSLSQLIAGSLDGPGRESLHTTLISNVVMPITPEDLVEGFRIREPGEPRVHHLSYIVLDCRAERSFSYARLPTAVHIGSNLNYSKERFAAMVGRFEEAKGSHFCVLGTGKEINEELNLLKVIGVQFVMAGFPHIATAIGGFKACIPFIKSEQIEYVRSYENLPKKAPASAPPSKPPEESIADKLLKEVSQVNPDKIAAKATATAAAVGGSISSFFKAKKLALFRKEEATDPEEEALNKWTSSTDPSAAVPAAAAAAAPAAKPSPEKEKPPPVAARAPEEFDVRTGVAHKTAFSFSLDHAEGEDDFEFISTTNTTREQVHTVQSGTEAGAVPEAESTPVPSQESDPADTKAPELPAEMQNLQPVQPADEIAQSEATVAPGTPKSHSPSQPEQPSKESAVPRVPEPPEQAATVPVAPASGEVTQKSTVSETGLFDLGEDEDFTSPPTQPAPVPAANVQPTQSKISAFLAEEDEFDTFLAETGVTLGTNFQATAGTIDDDEEFL
eukprot:TRINITY_DN8165_c0_g1_i1.p1 TRINITY_DN8165_c0_g1~~TRINITY_DN8165_c0_g1_i1.p1  ORF type:complete len:804 (-),score=161.47 TRINITY_DN8165_c0_g1_i1:7-2418(-)